ncbi:hypothetical protein P8452_26407 [Trifolium repens]|nr:hypothetical protein P8452_26407 [Trifolium repens]
MKSQIKRPQLWHITNPETHFLSLDLHHKVIDEVQEETRSHTDRKPPGVGRRRGRGREDGPPGRQNSLSSKATFYPKFENEKSNQENYGILDNQTQIFQEHSKETHMLCAETLRLKDKLRFKW